MEAPVKDRVEELMVRHGLTDVPITDLNKEKAVSDLLVAEALITRTLALDRFCKGLNCLGLGDLLRKYPVIKNTVFPTPDNVVVDPETLKRKLQHAKEQATESHKEDEQSWDWFLQFIEEAGSCEGANSYKYIQAPGYLCTKPIVKGHLKTIYQSEKHSQMNLLSPS